MDTSLLLKAGSDKWRNGGPNGCSRKPSSVQPTDDDKKKFKEALSLVRGLMKNDGKKEAKKADFQKALKKSS